MKKNNILLNLLLIIVCGFTFNLTPNAATSVKETSADFNGDVYVIGSTKFDNNTVVTATRAAQAGRDDALIQWIFGHGDGRTEIQTYYYNELEETWFLVPEEGGAKVPLTESEITELEENLDIYFVNNEEKIIEFEYSGDVNVDSIETYGNDSISGADVVYENGKFYIPVTIIQFSFTDSNDEEVRVAIDYNEEEDTMDLGNFYIPIKVYILDENGELIPDFYVETNKEGYIYPESVMNSYIADRYGYSVYYLDENDEKIDFNTFRVTESVNIKQAWNPKGEIELMSGIVSGFDVEYFGDIYSNEDGYYVPMTLVAPPGYDTTSTKVNGETVTFDEGKLTLEVPVTGKGTFSNLTIEWEEGIEVTFVINVTTDATYAYEVTFYNEKGDVYSTNLIREDQMLEVPFVTFAKENMVFDGWTTNTESNVKYDFSSLISDNLKLYPRFITLKEFVENSDMTNPAVLNSDIVVTSTTLLDANKDMYLDLGGHTIYINSFSDDIFRIKGNDISLIISHGTLEARGTAAAVVVGKSQENTSSVVKRNVTITNDVIINADYYGIAAFGKSQVDFSGTMNLANNGYGISGNGLANNEGTVFNIYEGANISVPNGAALYLPQLGETNIYGGNLTGYSVVGIKAGALNVYGGTLTSTGAYVAPKTSNDGMDMTGDTIIAEENASYADHITINIIGGTLNATGENTALIREFNPSLGTDHERTIKVSGLYATKNKVDDTTYVYTDSNEGDFEFDGTYYSKDLLKTYLEKSSAEKQVILRKDIELIETMLLDVDADMVLDLGGHTITSAVDVIRLKGNNSSLRVLNGTITTTGAAAPLKVGTSQEDTSSVVKRELSVENDVTLNALWYGIGVFGKSHVDFFGTINIEGDGYGISGNGLANNDGTVINIYDGSEINAPLGSALYLPQLGETNIYGGDLTGYSVVGIKAGTLNVYGGTLTSTGAYVAPLPKNDGMDMTGDVIIAEENASYADHITINIVGGTLNATDENTTLIREYNPSLGTDHERTVTVHGLYATRNSTEDEHTFIYTSSDDAKLEVNNVKYTVKDFKLALENSSTISPLVLLDDINLTETALLEVDKEMVLDLGGYEITSAVDVIRLKGNDSFLQVQNGTITTTGAAAPLKVGTSQEDTSSVVKRHLVVMENVTLNSVWYGIGAFGKSLVDFYGHINISSDGYGISGNGLANNEGTVFNIYDGSSIAAPNGAALYLPQLGVTNVYGGALTGYSVVGIKAGTLNISGGVLISDGAYVAPLPKNDGMDMTGDTIIAEENASYADHIQINITGGTLSANAENTAVIREYNPSLGTENERYVTVTGKYSTKNKVDNITYTYTETLN